MLITYKDSNDPVIVYKDQLFVQNQYKEYIKFNPRNLLFLTLSSPQLGQLTDKDIFVPHQKMTQDYHVYKKLQSEKEKILPLLRQTLTDSSLPDINYFPMGDYEISPGFSTQTVTPYGGKSEFLRWISWLGDKKSIPYIRELLFHTEDPLHYRDMPLGQDSPYIKDECIKALRDLGAKNILFEYLLQEKNPKYRYIQATLTALMQVGLNDTDLPLLMKLCERYESLDKPANELFEYYLEKLFWEGWCLGSMRKLYHRGILHDRDSDAPIQWLVCKAVSRIGTQKAVEFLEYVYQHTIYYELRKSALIGIRHRAFLQEDAFKHNISQVSATLIQRIHKDYLDGDNRDMIDTPIQHAMTDAADHEYREASLKREKQDRIESKNELAKRAEYFKTLKSGDTIYINSPFVCYDEEKLIGTIIENDGETLVIESQFNNKTKMGRRKFLIRNGLSNGPACFVDEGEGKKPYFYSLIIPQQEQTESHNIKPWDIRVRIYQFPEKDSENDDLIF